MDTQKKYFGFKGIFLQHVNIAGIFLVSQIALLCTQSQVYSRYGLFFSNRWKRNDSLQPLGETAA